MGYRLPPVTHHHSTAPATALSSTVIEGEGGISLKKDLSRIVIISFIGTLGNYVLAAMDQLNKLNNGTLHWNGKRGNKARGFSNYIITAADAKGANNLASYFRSEDYSKTISVLLGTEMYGNCENAYNLHLNGGKFPLDITNLSKIIPDIQFAHTGPNSIRFTSKKKKEALVNTLKEYNLMAASLERKKNVKKRPQPTFLALIQGTTYTTLGSLPKPSLRSSTFSWKNETVENSRSANSSPKSFFLLGLHVSMSREAIDKTLSAWGIEGSARESAFWYYSEERDTYAVAISTDAAEEYEGKIRDITSEEGSIRTYASTRVAGYTRCHSNGKVIIGKHQLIVPATADGIFKKSFTIGGGNMVDTVIKELAFRQEDAEAKTKTNSKPKANSTSLPRNQSVIAFASATNIQRKPSPPTGASNSCNVPLS
jgi:hypothetical protein